MSVRKIASHILNILSVLILLFLFTVLILTSIDLFISFFSTKVTNMRLNFMFQHSFLSQAYKAPVVVISALFFFSSYS